MQGYVGSTPTGSTKINIMGIGPSYKSSYSTYDGAKVTPGNPDPSNYYIMKHDQIGDFLIMEVWYPDCDNHEGRKLLVYKGLTIKEVKKFTTLDPHFSNNKKYASPIARFEPTLIGWGYARRMCRA